MKIYTRRGDGGETGLFGGGRRRKSDPRIAAYGDVDELNSTLGLARASVDDPTTLGRLATVQADLFAIGAHLATPAPEGDRPTPNLPPLPADRVGDMETWIDEASGETGPLRHFILPGGTTGAAQLHVCRTVCRRAERGVVELAEVEHVDGVIVTYLNRLSDYLFAAARLENERDGTGDLEWHGSDE